MLIFGSTAQKFWFPDSRSPKDLDLLQTGARNQDEKYWVPSFNYILENNKNKEYVDPDFLLTIKLSHSFWNIHWEKTIFDINFLKEHGCKIDEGLFKLLIKDWAEIHGKKRGTLNKTNEEFFQDAVKRKYDHDFLHQRVAYYERPLFEKIKPDLAKALCNQKMFNELSHLDQIRLCKEEIFVVALERFLIPNDFNFCEKAAFNRAFKHLVVSMTRGWFPRFMVENNKEIKKNEDWNLKGKIYE